MSNSLSTQLGACPEHFQVVRQWLNRFVDHVEGIDKRLRKLERKCSKHQAVATPVDDELLGEISRMQLALGNAKGFDPAIEMAIADYLSVRNELRELDVRQMSKILRSEFDLFATVILSHFALVLGRLEVSIHEIEPGTALDLGQHEVVLRLETHDVTQVNTVCQCLEPEFRWTSSQGFDRTQRAKVSAFTSIDESSGEGPDNRSSQNGLPTLTSAADEK